MITVVLYLTLAIIAAIWDNFIQWAVLIAFFWGFWKKFLAAFSSPKGEHRKPAGSGRHTAAANWDHLTHR